MSSPSSVSSSSSISSVEERRKEKERIKKTLNIQDESGRQMGRSGAKNKSDVPPAKKKIRVQDTSFPPPSVPTVPIPVPPPAIPARIMLEKCIAAPLAPLTIR